MEVKDSMTDPFLHDLFDKPDLHPLLRWHCEPGRWSVEPLSRCLKIEPNSGTDFWQKTHYGFEADNGHFLYAEVAGDFVIATQVSFHPVHQYDQAGLMVRVSPSCWLKTSVEYEPQGPSRLGAVVTNHGYSDWSTQDFPASRRTVGLRIHRKGGDYLVEAMADDGDWKQIRLTHLDEAGEGAEVSAGLYACSPKGAGFRAEFALLRIDRGGVS
jgi:regulation of enolase protein 1 (concanavalin A-like superfamily)